MKKTIAFCVFWLDLLLCSSRATDLFHITADEQLAKFQDLFRSLLSEDTKSLSKTVACFVFGNDPDGTDQVVLYDHDIVADSEIIYQCHMTQKNTGAKRQAWIKVSMENVYTDDHPDGIITFLYFTNVDQQNDNFGPASE